MSILGSIFSKILGHHGNAPGASTTTAPNAPPTGASGGAEPAQTPASATTRTPPVDTAPSPATPPASGRPSTSAIAEAGGPGSPAPAPAGNISSSGAQPALGPVDVAAVLDGLATSNSQTLDWRHSIVDMMKLLGLDSSLGARQTLAQELHYSGDAHDSATMNLWLHKQVMAKLAENGGKVPEDLRA